MKVKVYIYGRWTVIDWDPEAWKPYEVYRKLHEPREWVIDGVHFTEVRG